MNVVKGFVFNFWALFVSLIIIIIIIILFSFCDDMTAFCFVFYLIYFAVCSITIVFSETKWHNFLTCLSYFLFFFLGVGGDMCYLVLFWVLLGYKNHLCASTQPFKLLVGMIYDMVSELLWPSGLEFDPCLSQFFQIKS